MTTNHNPSIIWKNRENHENDLEKNLLLICRLRDPHCKKTETSERINLRKSCCERTDLEFKAKSTNKNFFIHSMGIWDLLTFFDARQERCGQVADVILSTTGTEHAQLELQPPYRFGATRASASEALVQKLAAGRQVSLLYHSRIGEKTCVGKLAQSGRISKRLEKSWDFFFGSCLVLHLSRAVCCYSFCELPVMF